MAKTQNSLLTRARVSRLTYGIHDNTMITKIDVGDRRRQGVLEKKMIYVTFAVIDPKEGKKKAEAELSWFRLDHSSEYLFSNIRELAVQLFSILNSYMDEEAAYKAMENVFDGYGFKTVDDIENHKWKKKEIDSLIDSFRTKFGVAMTPFIGDTDKLIRLKVTTDNKGEYVNIPKFGAFTESMDIKESNLKFTDFELRNHSKAGTLVNDGASNSVKTLG